MIRARHSGSRPDAGTRAARRAMGNRPATLAALAVALIFAGAGTAHTVAPLDSDVVAASDARAFPAGPDGANGVASHQQAASDARADMPAGSQAVPPPAPQPAAAATQDTPEARLAEGRRLFDSLDYERALVELDRAVTLLGPQRNDPAALGALRTALELRARTHFGLGAVDRAREDFQALITLSPEHQLPEDVSPRVIQLFTQVRAQLIGRLMLALDPADAQVRLDGRPFQVVADPVDVAAGAHSLTIARSGYTPATVSVTIEAGRTTEWKVTLERSSATLVVQTVPAGVEVWVNGTSRGKTDELKDSKTSAAFVIGELTPGTYALELRKPCFGIVKQRIEIDRLTDYRTEPFTLTPAVGTIQVGTPTAARILLDGRAIGDAPRTIDAICEGSHVVEARTRFGRDLRRIDVRAGARETLTLTPRPAVALLSGPAAGAAAGGAARASARAAAPAAGAPRGTSGRDGDDGVPSDVRSRVERALVKATPLFVYAPTAADVRTIEQQERAPAGWLAYDLARQPLPGSQPSAEVRRDLSIRLAKALDVQGVAAIVIPPGGGDTVWLSVLAAGASEPDVIELRLDKPETALAALDAAVPSGALIRRRLGLSLIDVLDRPGPVVLDAGDAPAAAAAAGAGAAQSGPIPGDALTHVNGTAVASEQDVRRVLEALGPAETATITLQGRAGTAREVALPVLREPRLVTVGADSGLANVALLGLRARLPEAGGLDATAIRLNLAGALMRVGDFQAALEELRALRLPDRPGVSQGSVHYLMGLCYEALGRQADARKAWDTAARAPRAVLSDDGPLVADLVARRLKPAVPR